MLQLTVVLNLSRLEGLWMCLRLFDHTVTPVGKSAHALLIFATRCLLVDAHRV